MLFKKLVSTLGVIALCFNALMASAEAKDSFRLPVIKTPADVKKLKDLDKGETALGLENLKKIPPTDGWYILGSDPDLQAFWQIWERHLLALLSPDMQAVPFSPINLMAHEVARISENDYLIGIFRQLTAVNIADFNKTNPDEDYTKLGLLEYPDSQVWSAEERLALKFTQATLENSMTDELFQEARNTWGDKMTLRYISWIGYVYQWAILENVLGMTFVPETMSFPKGSLSPEVVDTIVKKIEPTKYQVREFWNSLFEFEFHEEPGKKDH